MTAQQVSDEPPRSLALDLREAIATDAVPAPPRLLPMPGDESPSPRHKSIPLASILSAVVPGSGQIYAEAPLWRALLYGAVEAAGWTAYFVYNAKGDAATLSFQNYADAHWDVVRYVDWIAANYQRWSDDSVNKPMAAEALAAVYRSNNPDIPAWERVDFEQLNKLERAVKGGFSHTLPAHGEQQYYEEIGKYFQYRAGWDDHQLEGDTVIFAPSRVSARNHDYVGQREDANALGSYAMTALGLVGLNHVVSMVDALLAARHYNLTIRSESRGELLPNGRRGIVPALGMQLRF